MAVTSLSISDRGLQRVGLSIPEPEGEITSISGDPPRANGGGDAMSDSFESLESASSVSDGDEDKPAHPHHLKLLALSEVLMQSPAPDKTGGRKDNELSSAVGRSDIGLLEEARNRWRGRKERCVHWDKVEINGREFPLQRADTSSMTQLATTAGGMTGAGQSSNNNNSSDQAAAGGKSDTSHLLVGHSTCDMCLMSFEASSVSGVITMKRILEARRDWGLAGSKSKKYAAASSLYDSARLCALCSQFFCSKDANGRGEGEGGELAACGVGRSEEHVSLSLESMASNKPLPDKNTAVRAAAKAAAGRTRSHHRHRNGAGSGGDSTTSTGGKSSSQCRQEPRSNRSDSALSVEAAATANFRLDELIADDRFIVNETDLAKQPGAVASQSSTADGMGADVCMGFPAASRPRGGGGRAPSSPSGRGPRSPTNPQRRQDGAVREGRDPDGRNEEDTPIDPSVCDSTATGDPASPGFDKQTAAASAATQKATATAALVVYALSPAPAAKRATPAMRPRMLREDERAAAAAAAARTCSRTRRENQPWWEVDLGGAFPVRCIRVHHPDRRTEATKAGASPFVDVSPFWIMTSAAAIGEAAPEEARELAISSKRVGSHGKVTVWNLGINHFAAAVRVQAEGVKSLQLARVEVIKGGGTQQAKDAIQQQLLTRKADSSSCSMDDASSSLEPQEPASPAPLAKQNTTRSSNKPSGAHEHKMAKSSLVKFYQQDRVDGGGAASTPSAAAPKTLATSDTTTPTAATAKASVSTPGATTPPDAVGSVSPGPGKASATTSGGVVELGRKLPPATIAGGGSSEQSHQSQSYPAAAVAGESCSSSAVARCSTAEQGRKRRRRRRRREGGALPGEDVRRLLLRAMVGYDWVDEFNTKDVRVRGAFTEQDVVVLEEIFFRCAFGDDAQARATATVSDQSLRLDPGELCGDLRRLQLQVQTNPGGKGKTPMQLAIRDNFNLFQLFSSGVVEALPDALARAEAQLPAAQRPLGLDWTRFLGVMGLCLEGAYTGTGLLAPSAVARLFEEKTDDRLEFLTRRRSRLPPRSFAQDTAGARKERNRQRGLPVAAAAGSHGVEGTSEMTPRGAAGAIPGASGSVTGGFSSMEEGSLREAGSSIDAGDDAFLGSSATGSGGGSGSRGGNRQEGTPETTANAEDQDGGGIDNGWGSGRRARGGGAAALKSLLRPQARHEVFKGYGEAVSRRRERQRDALGRAPEPDVEPTRAYKPCGLCQAPFPVESLVSTVSLKVLGTFLAMAGAPSERFERKASRLCALHRLPLCVFCSQFFDPDYPGGVVPPKGFTAPLESGGRRGSSRRRSRGRDAKGDLSLSPTPRLPSSSLSPSSTISVQRPLGTAIEANGLVPFFDDRFPNRWSETPPPSSAPAARAYSPPRPSMLTQTSPFGASTSSCPSTIGLHKGQYHPTQSAAGKGSSGGGDAGGGGGGGRQHVCEATELREVGGLVRRGCSIRDRLAMPT